MADVTATGDAGPRIGDTDASPDDPSAATATDASPADRTVARRARRSRGGA